MPDRVEHLAQRHFVWLQSTYSLMLESACVLLINMSLGARKSKQGGESPSNHMKHHFTRCWCGEWAAER